MYVADPSEQCGYTLEQQISLFNNIRPLFANKPLIFVLNKTDIIRMEDLSAEKKSVMDEIVSDPDILMLEMSTFTEDGVMTVKQEVRILCCHLYLNANAYQFLKHSFNIMFWVIILGL